MLEKSFVYVNAHRLMHFKPSEITYEKEIYQGQFTKKMLSTASTFNSTHLKNFTHNHIFKRGIMLIYIYTLTKNFRIFFRNSSVLGTSKLFT